MAGGAGKLSFRAPNPKEVRELHATWDPATGVWNVRYAASGNNGAPFTLGQKGDIPMPGVYDGCANARAAVFRPSTGEYLAANTPWYLSRGLCGGATSAAMRAMASMVDIHPIS